MTAKTDTTCTGPGPDGTACGRHAKYKGLCDTHRKQQVRGRPLTPPRLFRTTCTADGCTRAHMARGFCNAHYEQWRYGRLGAAPDPSVAPKPCPGPGHGDEPCGRDVVGRGLCQAHCRQARLGQPLQPLRLTGQAVVKARGGVVRNGATRGRTGATRSKPTPKPEPAGNLPPGWFKPSPKPARPARENNEEMINVIALTNIPKISPEDEQRARRTAGRFAPADQLDDVLAMLGLAS